ncbi:MAG: helix-turn-helix transcriptional regulator [Chloroflexi bacterium]|nr:helix-turn-helix transcriptional regulator [Chloroflexota bacterium]
MSSEVAIRRGRRHRPTVTSAAGSDGRAGPATLSTREREVLGLMAEGLSNAAIGRRLGISITTVRSHVKAVLEKLECHSRLQAVVSAYELSARDISPGGGRPRVIK